MMIKMIGKFLRVDYARPWAKNCDTNADAQSIYGICIGLSVHTIFPQILKTKPALFLFMKISPAKTVKLKISSCDVLVSFKSRHGSSTYHGNGTSHSQCTVTGMKLAASPHFLTLVSSYPSTAALLIQLTTWRHTILDYWLLQS